MKPSFQYQGNLHFESPVGLRYKEWEAFDLKSILVMSESFWFCRA